MNNLFANKKIRVVIIYYDNQSAITLAKSSKFHAQSKYINVQLYYKYKQIENGSFKFRYILTKEQIADSLTKAF